MNMRPDIQYIRGFADAKRLVEAVLDVQDARSGYFESPMIAADAEGAALGRLYAEAGFAHDAGIPIRSVRALIYIVWSST